MQKDGITINGLDLKIDENIHKICEASNSTSTNSRSTLYILMVISILVLIILINTNKWNWTIERLNSSKCKIKELKSDLLRTKAELYHFRVSEQKYFQSKPIDKAILKYQNILIDDTTNLSFELSCEIRNYENLLKLKLEKFQTVQVPFLFFTFDVDALALISGISFLLLEIILIFTIHREIINLMIAFIAITERYPANSDYSHFKEYLDKEHPGKQEKALKLINYIRRQHHYNFLTMNEIFTLPPFINPNSGNERKQLPGFHSLIKYMYWYPYILYIIIAINDMATIDFGKGVSIKNTAISFSISFLLSGVIFLITKKCHNMKRFLESLYKMFEEREYNFDPEILNKSIPKTRKKLLILVFGIYSICFSILIYYVCKESNLLDFSNKLSLKNILISVLGLFFFILGLFLTVKSIYGLRKFMKDKLVYVFLYFKSLSKFILIEVKQEINKKDI